MIKKMLQQSKLQRQTERDKQIEQQLLRRESQLGGRLFGPVATGDRREFFCLDERTWVWHEEWTNKETGQHQVQTTRYEVRTDRILKVRDGQYKPVEATEARHLLDAAKLYQETMQQKLYSAN